MPDDTLELVIAGLRSWRHGDEQLMRGVFHPDALFIDHTRPDALELRGHEGFLRAYRSWVGAWQSGGLDWRDPVVLAPGLVLVAGRMSGIAKASNIPVEMAAAGLYWVAGGRVLRVEIFGDEEAAREAAARLA